MSSEQDSDGAATGPQRQRRVQRRLAAAAVVVFIGVVSAIFVSWSSPRLGRGGLSGPDVGMSWANDGIENTRMVVHGKPVATVGATFSISNEGHLPFTVHGLELTHTIYWFSKQRVTFVTGLGFGKKVQLSSQLTLRPGELATVPWSLDTACEPEMADGSSMTIDALRFRVSWWGGTAIRDLPLEKPITFLGDSTTSSSSSSNCDGD